MREITSNPGPSVAVAYACIEQGLIDNIAAFANLTQQSLECRLCRLLAAHARTTALHLHWDDASRACSHVPAINRNHDGCSPMHRTASACWRAQVIRTLHTIKSLAKLVKWWQVCGRTY